jgi:hypothetical protein
MTHRMVRFAFVVLWSVALPAATAWAQAAAGGSVTVLSRPPGASFRLQGPQTVAGRTPMTVARGLGGPFVVTGSAPGYETWRRKMTLTGSSPDTVWMTLSPKSAAMGAARSLVLPGWGQIYNERPGHAWAMGGLVVGAAAFVGVAQLRYVEREDIYDDLIAEGSTNTALVNRARESLEDASEVRDLALMALGGAWAVNVIDALVFGPPAVDPGTPLGFVPWTRGPGMALAVRF